MICSFNTPIIPLTKTSIFTQSDDSKMRIVVPQPIDTVVAASIVDHDDFLVFAGKAHGFLQRRKAFFEQMPAIPV